MKQKNARDAELKQLCSFKTYSGLLRYANYLGIIVLIIGLVCPYCYYNPGTLDLTKRSIYFWDLSFAYNSITIISVILAFGISEISKFLTNWRTRKKIFIFSASAVCFLVILAFVIQTIACIFYEIPQQNLSMLEIEFDVGYYLFAIGNFIFAITYAIFVFILIKIINGKITIDSITFIKEKTTNEKSISNSSIKEQTLTEKLEEITRLKDNGIISEEEYQAKKLDLLNRFN